MDALPVLFYEATLSYFDYLGSLDAFLRLNGLLGELALDLFKQAFSHHIFVNNGRLDSQRCKSASNRFEINYDAEKIRSKYNKKTVVVLRASGLAYETDPGMIETLQAATRGKDLTLALATANISNEMELWINSLKIGYFHINTSITGVIQRIIERMVKKKTLHSIFFMIDKPLEPAVIELLVALFKQEQFLAAQLPKDCSYVMQAMRHLIDSWRTQSAKMAGKHVWCENVFVAFLRTANFGFVDCTEEEEERYVSTLYPVGQGIRGRWSAGQRFSASVLRNRNGHAIYWLFPENEAADNLVLFV